MALHRETIPELAPIPEFLDRYGSVESPRVAVDGHGVPIDNSKCRTNPHNPE
jgi:hypothetical protein